MTSINDQNGCSTCKAGEENYTTFEHRGKMYYQYDYRHTDGKLFTTIAPSLDICRAKRDLWLK